MSVFIRRKILRFCVCKHFVAGLFIAVGQSSEVFVFALFMGRYVGEKLNHLLRTLSKIGAKFQEWSLDKMQLNIYFLAF